MSTYLIRHVPDGLTSRARMFVSTHGVKVDVKPVEERRRWWVERGVSDVAVDRMADFQQRWGGLILPPGPQYDGGPLCFDPDSPGPDPAGWWFEAGLQRTAVPYAFLINPSGEFGIHGERWAPLHATVEGWVESLALAHHAAMWAKRITRLVGDEVEGIELAGYEPVREVAGLADTWWRGPGSLIAVYTGEAEALAFPRGRTALIYSGLDE